MPNADAGQMKEPECPSLPSDLTPEGRTQLACGGTCEPSSCRSGPCAVESVVEDSNGPTVLALDDSFLYWGTTPSQAGASPTAAIRRLSSNGAVEQVAVVDGAITGLTKHGERLYWTLEKQEDGSTASEIASMIPPNGPIVRIEKEGSLRSVGLTDTSAYWADFDRGVFTAAVVDGLIVGPANPFGGWVNAVGLFVYESTVFWTQVNLDNSIRYKMTGDSSPAELVVCYQGWPSSVTVDAQRVYWMNTDLTGSTGRIMSLERSGGVPRVLLDQRARPKGRSLVGDGTYLYWIENDAVIMRMAK
jgi:hypothetical protein